MATFIGGRGIQWQGSINSPGELASVIQGESATPAGQFAVASVIYNRIQNGGFGSGVFGVVTPTQFNGFNPNPGANAQSLANDIWSGNAPQGGTTGNALYFANPAGSTASWPATLPGSGAPNIGGNYYSDNMGPPSGNFVAPNYGGSGSTIAEGPASSGFGGNGDSVSSAGPMDPNFGDITGYPVAGVNAPLDGSGATTGSGSSAAPSGQGGIGSDAVASGTAGDVAQPGSQPLAQGLQQGTINAISSWIGNIESAMGSGLKSAVTAAENAVGTYLGSVGNWFVRAFLIIVGIVIIFAALLAIFWDHGGKETVVNMGKMAAA